MTRLKKAVLQSGALPFFGAPGRARRLPRIMRFPHNTGQGAGLEIGDEWPRAVVERGGITYECLRARQDAPCAGTHKPAPYASTLRALFVNRRTPSGTYGGVRGEAGDDPTYSIRAVRFLRGIWK